MPRPPLPPGSRKSRLRDRTAGADFDNVHGYWPRERLIKMDREFVEAMKRHLGETAEPAPGAST